jgi:hypothetical protein
MYDKRSALAATLVRAMDVSKNAIRNSVQS